ncbi:hypothetical protein ASPTUDRAFT_37555 [Aspergillus tubingensis CBS 134.48]|uniref:Uncharacterized protein n=1 Tax=Aspergillus tubingensis (strain CBS 134.48) TaxID=767770 RepID=A0A1L9NNH5_ASPTC|nr:hypothetical protein ASPTUDRAFT_37555 [Aspergillus tubingensis CBS 134.48]
MDRDKVATNGSILFLHFLPTSWSGNSLQEGFSVKKRKEEKSSGRMRGSSGSGGSAADIGRNADWLGKQAKVVPGTDQWAVETHGGGV